MGYERYKRIDFGIRDFNSHVGKKLDGLEGVHEGNGIEEQNFEDRMVLKFCDKKDLCVRIHGLRRRRKGK